MRLRSTARVLLGLFVVWQLLFLLASNALDALRAVRWASADSSQPAAADGPLSAGLRRWAEWTGQTQQWQLFAPNLADLIPFPAVELRWRRSGTRDEGERDSPGAVAVLRSDNEPAERRRFWRLGRFRLRRYESTLEVAPALRGGEPFDPTGPAWRDTIRERVQQEQRGMRAYLRWRVAEFARRHPDLPPPDEALLLVRLSRIPPPPGPQPWDWQDLGEYPVARWRPGAPGLEVYDPVRGRFAMPEEP